MRKILKKATAVLLAAAMTFTPVVVNAEEQAEHLELTIQAATEQAAQLMEMMSIAGMTIAMVDIDNDFTWFHTLGYADATNQIPVTEQTLFNIGSTAKVFTAVAIMQLVEAGVLDLDEPIVTYLPEFRVLPNPIHGGNYRNITTRMLLTHVSGMHELHGDGVSSTEGKDRDFMNRLLPTLANLHMQNEEFNRITYNNTAYALLGILVSRLTGSENYFDGFINYTQENIFTPAGMTSSSFDVNDSNRENIALVHIDATTLLGAYIYYSATSAGGMVSNAYDMALFMHVILSGGGDILLPETVAAMRQPQDFGIPFPNCIPNAPMGLGIMHVIHADGVATTGHGGNLLHHTELLLDFDNGIGVFVSVNTIAAAGAPTPLANMILRAAVEEKTGSPMPATASTNLIPFTDVERIVGWYAGLILGSTTEIVLDEEGLLHIYGIPGLPALPLTPVADGSFESIIGSLWFQEVEGIVFMHLGLQTAPVLIGERIEISYASADFVQWVGEYHYILSDGEIGAIATIGISEDGFAYSRQGDFVVFMNQADGNNFHFPGRIREFGSIVRFSMEDDSAIMRYSTFKFVRVSPVDDADELSESIAPTNTQLRFVIGNTEFSLDGEPHYMEGAPFVESVNNRTMIPLSVVAEIFGAEVGWVAETQIVTIALGEINLTVSAVEPLPYNMGMAHNVNGYIFIPLRYIAYAFGMHVSWDGINQAVYVFTDSAN